MTDIIEDLIKDFDRKMSERFTGKHFHLAEIVAGQSEIYPVTVSAAKRERVAPHDTYSLQTYHRLQTATRGNVESEFGRDIIITQPMLLTVISDPSMGESFVIRYVRNFPKQIKALGAYAVIEDDWQINYNQAQIVSTEFGALPADKHQLVKNIAQITYTLRVVLSYACLPEFNKCNWILELGKWDDEGCWKDIEVWID